MWLVDLCEIDDDKPHNLKLVMLYFKTGAGLQSICRIKDIDDYHELIDPLKLDNGSLHYFKKQGRDPNAIVEEVLTFDNQRLKWVEADWFNDGRETV